MEREKPGIPVRNLVEIVNGTRTESMEDISWEEVRGHRNAWLLFTDIYALNDLHNNLTAQQQTEINTFRQALRDATNYATANDACDNFPTPPTWL